MFLYVTDSLQEQEEEEAAPPQKLQELDAAGRENSSPEPQSLAGARLLSVGGKWKAQGFCPQPFER